MGIRQVRVWASDKYGYGRPTSTGMGVRQVRVWASDKYGYGRSTSTGMGVRQVRVWAYDKYGYGRTTSTGNGHSYERSAGTLLWHVPYPYCTCVYYHIAGIFKGQKFCKSLKIEIFVEKYSVCNFALNIKLRVYNKAKCSQRNIVNCRLSAKFFCYTVRISYTYKLDHHHTTCVTCAHSKSVELLPGISECVHPLHFLPGNVDLELVQKAIGFLPPRQGQQCTSLLV